MPPLFDPTQLMENVDHDPDLHERILALFIDAYPKRVQAIHDALAQDQLQRFAEAVHELKGELLVFGHAPALALVQEWESQIRDQKLPSMNGWSEKLNHVVKPILDYIESKQQNKLAG